MSCETHVGTWTPFVSALTKASSTRLPGQMGTHKWVTDDLVLVECLLAAPASGVRLASLGPGRLDRARLTSSRRTGPADNSHPSQRLSTSARRIAGVMAM